MSRIVIELAGEDDIIITRRQKKADAPRMDAGLRAPSEAPALMEITYDELHGQMPGGYRELFEEYFKKK